MAVEKLDKSAFLDLLRPDQVNVLSNTAQHVHMEAGQKVYEKGQRAFYFYIILNGQVALRLPGKQGVSVLIDQLHEGNMFGGCISSALETYALTAQCTVDTELLKIETSVLKELMDEDLRMGYIIQSQISAMYFKRYIETMEKLQAIVLNIPIATG
jgi:CRP-like cAMP-binding protein